MHECIAKFGDMVECAYSIKPTDSASIILASNFIEGAQNPHVKNKLRVLPGQKLERYIWSHHSGASKTKNQGTRLWGEP